MKEYFYNKHKLTKVNKVNTNLSSYDDEKPTPAHARAGGMKMQVGQAIRAQGGCLGTKSRRKT